MRQKKFFVAFLHFVFFHVLACTGAPLGEEAKGSVKPVRRKAGNWFFSTIPLSGFKTPLQIAALPSTTPVATVDGKKQAPYLVLYCQEGSARELNAFVDWRKNVSFIGNTIVKINGIEASVKATMPLVPGDLSRMKLPAETAASLREASLVEVTIRDEHSAFVMLHWQEIRRRLLRSCGAN